MKKKILILLGVLAVAGLGIYLGRLGYLHYEKAKQERLLREVRLGQFRDLQRQVQQEIRGYRGQVGLVIEDLETGWKFSHREAELFPSASIAKMPIMATYFAAADQGHLKLDTPIELKTSDKLTGSGGLKNMPSGSKYTIEQLIQYMIGDSDNTATHMLTNLVGLDYINQCARAFGLKNTDLARKVADYRSRDRGIENFTTAEDMALLVSKMYHNTFQNKKVSTQCIDTMKLTHLRDRIPKYLPEDVVVAHKTGLEKTVCHDVGVIYTPKGDVMVIVLTKHKDETSALSKELIAKVSLQAYEYALSEPSLPSDKM